MKPPLSTRGRSTTTNCSRPPLPPLPLRLAAAEPAAAGLPDAGAPAAAAGSRSACESAWGRLLVMACRMSILCCSTSSSLRNAFLQVHKRHAYDTAQHSTAHHDMEEQSTTTKCKHKLAS
jgi:hypothetical protein